MDITNFKGHIFDLDGTLIESNGVWAKIDEEFLGRRGIAVPEDYFKKVSVMNFEQAAVYTNESFGLGEDVEDICREWFDMAVYEYSNAIGLCGNAGEYVKNLYDSGKRLALATASSAALYEPVLKRNGIYGYFHSFASTEEVSRGKGFPDVYELAAKRLGLDPADCIVYEDICEGVKGARLGGFHTAACLNEHYSADWNEMREQAEYVIENGNFLRQHRTKPSGGSPAVLP